MITGILIGLPSIALSALQQGITPPSRISSVTVYEDRALVTRISHLTLEPVEYRVALGDLPEGILRESLRAFGSGTAKVTITGLEVERTFLERSGEARVRELEDLILKLEDEKRRNQDEIEARRSQQKFLASIQLLSSDQVSKELTIKSPNVVEYQQVLNFLYTGISGVNSEIQRLEINQRDLGKKLNVHQQELQQIRSMGTLSKNTVVVSLRSEKGGPFDLEVSYVIPGAGWRPSYDARVIGNPGKVELQYYGEVWQRTGEDWPEAKITLSTARPAIGGRVPDLGPWILNFFSTSLYDRDQEDSRISKLKEGMRSDRVVPGEKPSASEDLFAQSGTVQVRASGTSVIFETNERKEVTSNGTPHKFTIAIDHFKPELHYETVPKLSSYAYLHSKVKNEAEYPLLAGPVNIFMGPDFIGKSSIENIAPTEEFPLYLGVDEGIKIKRDLVKKEKGKSGFIVKREKMLYVYKTTIESFKKEKVSLILKDQVPVSQDKEILITDVKITPVPKEEKRDSGELLWEFELAPKEKREITLEFSVEFPVGKEIAGLF